MSVTSNLIRFQTNNEPVGYYLPDMKPITKTNSDSITYKYCTDIAFHEQINAALDFLEESLCPHIHFPIGPIDVFQY